MANNSQLCSVLWRQRERLHPCVAGDVSRFTAVCSGSIIKIDLLVNPVLFTDDFLSLLWLLCVAKKMYKDRRQISCQEGCCLLGRFFFPSCRGRSEGNEVPASFSQVSPSVTLAPAL